MLAIEFLGQRVEPFDAFGDPVEWLTPEQLNVGLFGRDFFRSGRCAAEIQLGMTAFVGAEGSRLQRRMLDGEVFAVEGDVLLSPQSTDQLPEFASSVIPARLVEGDVAVRSGVVGSGYHIHQQPAAAELVEGGGGAGEMRGVPIAGTDGDQRGERRGPGGDRGGGGKRG